MRFLFKLFITPNSNEKLQSLQRNSRYHRLIQMIFRRKKTKNKNELKLAELKNCSKTENNYFRSRAKNKK